MLFDTLGISRCRSQHISVESSSLLHHSIYLWFICFTWWSIDELENLHADRITVCFVPWQKLRARKTGLSPPVFLYWPFQGGTSVVVPYCSCYLCLYFGSSIMLVTYFVIFRLLNDHLFGKELFIRFAASAFRKLSSVYVFSYFPFGFEGRIWDLIVSVPDYCLSFYFTYNGKNKDMTFSRLFLIGSFSYLQVMRTYIKAYMSLNFGKIPPLTTELAALECLKNRCHQRNLHWYWSNLFQTCW